MKPAIIPLLLLLTACASTRRESAMESYRASADSVSMHHSRTIRNCTDSANSRTFITIDSVNITADSIPQLRAYGVRIKRKSNRKINETISQTSDSVTHISESSAAVTATEHTEAPTASPLLLRLAAAIIVAAVITAIFKLIRF